jgi:PAS domain S-box-containing protein
VSHILVIEDNSITRKLLRFTLEAEGHTVVEAGDERQALAAFRQRRPDLVLVDYVLPDADGLHVLGEIRRLPAGAGVPAVLLTGMVSQLESLRAQAPLHVHFVAKPVEPSRLVEIVRAQLAGSDGEVGRGRRVLVVDDELIHRKLAALRLRQMGFEVQAAASAEEALAQARREPPHAILTDVLMPGTDGFLLCQAVREDPALRAVPVVLVSSSYSEPADHALAEAVGANALTLRSADLGASIDALVAALQEDAPAPGLKAATIAGLHRERLHVQLDKQVERNESLLRRSAIQAAGLSVLRGLGDALARPGDVAHTLGDVLVNCLDAAGLSTGLLYLRDPSGQLRLHSAAGVSAPARAEAERCFGCAGLLERVLAGRQPTAFSLAAAAGSPMEEEGRRLLHQLKHGSVLVVPFVVMGEAFGALILAAESHDLSEGSWTLFARELALQFGQTVAFSQTVARLLASEERYRLLLEKAHDAMILIGGDGRIREANQMSERLLGRPRAQIVGRPYADFTAPGPSEVAAGLAELLRASGSLQVEDGHVTRADGSQVPVDVSATQVEVSGEPIVLAILRDRTEKRRDEAALREVRERLEHVVASSPAVLYQVVVAGALPATATPAEEVLAAAERGLHIRWISPNVESILGYSDEDPERQHWWRQRVHVEDQVALAGSLIELFQGRPRATEYRMRHKNGTYRWVRSENRLLCDPAGRPVEIVGSWSDITHKRSLEAQLAQAQKIELLGQLAGGVAHDFNNLLGVISGYGELLRRKLAGNETVRDYLSEIMAAASRATGLTRQLLAFSRKQIMQPRVIDLNAVVTDVSRLLRHLIGEDIEVVMHLEADLARVRADPGQIEQVLMNLAINARDAMPRGGTLTIKTGNVELAPGDALPYAGLEPGRYVLMSISDIGHGMDAATQARVFEPFFTTKEPGKGTGLGLATVHGIVKQSGGHVLLHSERGRGTTFTIYLPRVEAGPSASASARVQQDVPKGTETVLLTEDEDALRALLREWLREAGYTVLAARHPDQALAHAAAHPGPIHLLLTDVVMPGLGGRELAEQITASRPETKVLYVSGYTDDAVMLKGVLADEMAFLQKPITAEVLLRRVRDVIDGRK